MSEVKVNIYTAAGQHVGHFLNPKIESFPDDDYQISGRFYDETGKLANKVDFNPQVLAYMADLSDVKGAAHKQLKNVYLQRGRQPVCMTGAGAKLAKTK